jgi:hypothetical protein
MKQLQVPVPGNLTASYLVPLVSTMTDAEARQRAIEAVEVRLNGLTRLLLLEWLRTDAVTIEVTAAPDGLVPGPRQRDGLTPEQLARFTRARAIAWVTATSAASLIAVHEWKALGPAAALAASLGAPLVDGQAIRVLSASDALTALPDLNFSDTPGGDVCFDLMLQPWVSFHGFAREGTYWAVSEGMRRFGLPEFRVGGCERDLRAELKEILSAVVFRVWSDLVAVAQATPGATGLVSMPHTLSIPAELNIHRRDLDRARGVPNRGGAAASISLHFDPEPNGRGWLTVGPPTEWDTGWDDFVHDLCHAMFGFEKPPWHYLPDIGALLEAISSLPEARRRFNDGELPTGAYLMVRYEVADDQPFRWARVESWADDDHAIVSDGGRELSPAIKPGPAISVETERIMDWAIWTDGKGVTEGALTESVSPGF